MNSRCVALYLLAVFVGTINDCLSDKQEDGICDNSTTIPKCCPDHIYNETMKKCEVCVGRFGVNCSQTCKLGYYGRRCINRCTCTINLCDEALGCLTTASGTDLKVDYLRLLLRLMLSLSAFIVIVLVGTLLRIVYRFKRCAETGFDTEIHNDRIGNMIVTDSSAIYSAALCPNRTPVRGVQQHDQMYGNTMIS